MSLQGKCVAGIFHGGAVSWCKNGLDCQQAITGAKIYGHFGLLAIVTARYTTYLDVLVDTVYRYRMFRLGVQCEYKHLCLRRELAESAPFQDYQNGQTLIRRANTTVLNKAAANAYRLSYCQDSVSKKRMGAMTEQGRKLLIVQSICLGLVCIASLLRLLSRWCVKQRDRLRFRDMYWREDLLMALGVVLISS